VGAMIEFLGWFLVGCLIAMGIVFFGARERR